MALQHGMTLGKKLVRLWFRGGEPFLQIGIVSRVTATTFDVTHSDGVDKGVRLTGKLSGWFKRNWLAAIDWQLDRIFGARQILIPGNFKDWSTIELVQLVLRIWRFRRKCLKKLSREDE